MDLHIELSLYQFLIVASVDNKLRRIKSAATIITLILVYKGTIALILHIETIANTFYLTQEEVVISTIVTL